MSHVVAVSVSTPRLVDIGGRPIMTSIVRDPVAGPVMFDMGGPSGNATAVHTEEVLATSTETYDHWMQVLGISSRWPACYWGENLTVSGLDEHSLRIGDRLKVGSNAVLEVTSPRIPCFKLTWRLEQPESFLQTLVRSGRTGFYLRVLNPGPIQAGDEIVHESPDVEHITVASLSRLLHEDKTDVEQLQRVLSIPALGAQASAMLRNRITQLTDGARTRAARWQDWRRFKVARVSEETPQVRSFTLLATDDTPVAQYRAGQFLTVRLPEKAGQGVARPWSLSDYSEGGSSYRLTIRRDPNGVATRYMHESVQVGDLLDVRAPQGRFVLDRSTVFRVVLISAGIGVTPVLSMLKAHAMRQNPPPLVWIHTARDGSHHVLRDEAAALISSVPQFRSYIAYTAPRAEDRIGIDYDQAGRISAERYAGLLAQPYECKPFGRVIELPGFAGAFYICGPRAFEEDVRRALIGFGVDSSSVFSERFGATPADTSDAAETCMVHFSRSNRTVEWAKANGESLLELAERNGLTPACGCRSGACGACETGLRAGKVVYDVEPQVLPEPGRVLLCCAWPASPTLEIDA